MDESRSDRLVNHENGDIGGCDNEGFCHVEKAIPSSLDVAGKDHPSSENGYITPSPTNCSAAGVESLPNGQSSVSELPPQVGGDGPPPLNGSAVVVVNGQGVNGNSMDTEEEDDDDNVNLNTDTTKELKCPLDTKLRHYVPIENDAKMLNSDDLRIAIPDDTAVDKVDGKLMVAMDDYGPLTKAKEGEESEKIPLQDMASTIPIESASEKALEAAQDHHQNGKTSDDCADTSMADHLPNDKVQQGNGAGYEEYFIPVNTHKKYLRGEKLYLTKDSKKICQNWRRVVICGLIAIVIAVAVLVGVLAATGILLAESESKNVRNELPHVAVAGHHSSSKLKPKVPHKFSGSRSTTKEPADSHPLPEVSHEVPTQQDPSQSQFVPNALVGELVIIDENFTDDLRDTTSDNYMQIKTHLEAELIRVFGRTGAPLKSVEVLSLRPGSIRVKFVVQWEKDHRAPRAKHVMYFMNQYLKSRSNSFLGFQVDPSSLNFTDIHNDCFEQKGGCSYDCHFDYDTLTKTCVCEEGMELASDETTCRKKAVTELPVTEVPSTETAPVATEPDEHHVNRGLPATELPAPETERPPTFTESNAVTEPTTVTRSVAVLLPTAEAPTTEHFAGYDRGNALDGVVTDNETPLATETVTENTEARTPHVHRHDLHVFPGEGFSTVAEMTSSPSETSPQETTEPEVLTAETRTEDVTETSTAASGANLPGSSSESSPSVIFSTDVSTASEPPHTLGVAIPEEPLTTSVYEETTAPAMTDEPVFTDILIHVTEMEHATDSVIRTDTANTKEILTEPTTSTSAQQLSDTSVNELPPAHGTEATVTTVSNGTVSGRNEVTTFEYFSTAETSAAPFLTVVTEDVTSETTETTEPADLSTHPPPTVQPSVDITPATPPPVASTDTTTPDVTTATHGVYETVTEYVTKPITELFSTLKTFLATEAPSETAMSTESGTEASTFMTDESVQERPADVTTTVLSHAATAGLENSTVESSTVTVGASDATRVINSEVSEVLKIPTEPSVTQSEGATPESSTKVLVPEPENPSTTENSATDILVGDSTSATVFAYDTTDDLTENATRLPSYSSTTVTETSGAGFETKETTVASVPDAETTSTVTEETVNLLVPLATDFNILTYENETSTVSSRVTDDSMSSSVGSATEVSESATIGDENFVNTDQFTNIGETTEFSTVTALHNFTGTADENVTEAAFPTLATENEILGLDDNATETETLTDVTTEYQSTTEYENYTVYGTESFVTESTTQEPSEYATTFPSTTVEFSTTEEIISTTENITDMYTTVGVECREDQFLCEYLNSCMNNTFVCDGIIDCPGGYDEANCSETCMLNFKCLNSSTCITSEAHCDGVWDCSDGSDEENCTPTECAKHEVMCLDGSFCIKPGHICDWKYNCRDRSDEVGCVERTTCESGGRFFCNDGLCIPWSLKCDGINDCKDGEDEGNCTCLEDEFKCIDGRCVKSSARCDGHQDCLNGEDEMGCVSVDEQGMVLAYETYSGTWSLVCAEEWNLDYGHYLCQELGFGHALSTESYHVSFNGTWMTMKRENLTVNSLWTERVTYADGCSSNLAATVTCQEFDCGNYTGLLHRRRRRHVEESFIREKRQIDSSSTQSSQWPFIAYVSTFKSPKGCLSEILTPVWLVTSAECLLSIGKDPHNGSDWYVRTNLADGLNSDLTRNHEVLKIIIHPHSSKFRSLIIRDYDVALIRLKHALVFSEQIGAICLPEERVAPGITCFSGVLGAQEPRASPPESPSISSLALMVVHNSVCNLREHYNDQVNQRMLCTKSSDLQHLCDNDEGTPLMCLSGPNKWYLAGTLTYQRYCNAYNTHPAIFSSLFAMRPFIEQVISKKQYNIPYDSSMYVIVPPTTEGPTETTTELVESTTEITTTTVESVTTTTTLLATTPEAATTVLGDQELARSLDEFGTPSEMGENGTDYEVPYGTENVTELADVGTAPEMNTSLEESTEDQGAPEEPDAGNATEATVTTVTYQSLNDSGFLSFRQPGDSVEPDDSNSTKMIATDAQGAETNATVPEAAVVSEIARDYVVLEHPNFTAESSGYRSLVEDLATDTLGDASPSSSPQSPEVFSEGFPADFAGNFTQLPVGISGEPVSDGAVPSTTDTATSLTGTSLTSEETTATALSSVASPATEFTEKSPTVISASTTDSPGAPVDKDIAEVAVADALRATDIATDVPSTLTVPTAAGSGSNIADVMYRDYVMRSRNVDVPVSFDVLTTTDSVSGGHQTTGSAVYDHADISTVTSMQVNPSTANSMTDAVTTDLSSSDSTTSFEPMPLETTQQQGEDVVTRTDGAVATEQYTTTNERVTEPVVTLKSLDLAEKSSGTDSSVVFSTSTEISRDTTTAGADQSAMFTHTESAASTVLPQGNICGSWNFTMNSDDDEKTVSFSEWPSAKIISVIDEGRNCVSAMISPHYSVASSNCLHSSAVGMSSSNLVAVYEEGVKIPVMHVIPVQTGSESSEEKGHSVVLVKHGKRSHNFACVPERSVATSAKCVALSANSGVRGTTEPSPPFTVTAVVVNMCNSDSNHSIQIGFDMCMQSLHSELASLCKGRNEALLFCLDETEHWEVQGFLHDCDNSPMPFTGMHTVKQTIQQITLSAETVL